MAKEKKEEQHIDFDFLKLISPLAFGGISIDIKYKDKVYRVSVQDITK